MSAARAERVTKRIADLAPGDVVLEWEDSPLCLRWTVTSVDRVPVQSFGQGPTAYRYVVRTDSSLVWESTNPNELRRIA